MDFTSIKEKAQALFSEASFIAHIKNNTDYENALALMDELIEDYDSNKPLIEVLSNSIERWENEDASFKRFNKAVQNSVKKTHD